MKKAIIGIVENKIQIDSDAFMGAYRCYANYPYINAVEKNGGVPVSIPFVKDKDNLQIQLSLCDGIILTGGGDIDPSLYGQQASYNCGSFDREIDQFYLDVIVMAKKLHKPILGICKGNQAINVAYGGTLIQDIASSNFSICHSQKCHYDQFGHKIDVKDNTFLSNIMDKEDEVNSYHHQAVDKLGSGLTVCALSKDGIIESICDSDNKVYGIQWHPEMLSISGNVKADKLFAFFIDQCK